MEDQQINASDIYRLLTELSNKVERLEAAKTTASPIAANTAETETPFFNINKKPGQHTIRRYSSAFDGINGSNGSEEEDKNVSDIQLTIAEVKVDPKDQMQRLSHPAILWLLEKHDVYKRTSAEAKTGNRKGIAHFIHQDVLEQLTASERAKNTELSIYVKKFADWYDVPDDKVLNALVRATRPRTKTEAFNSLMKAADKAKLPELPEFRVSDSKDSAEYRFATGETYERGMDVLYNTWIKTVCDSAKLIYRECTEEERRNLPSTKYGKKEDPGILRMILATAGGYMKSLLQGLGGDAVLHGLEDIDDLRSILVRLGESMISESRRQINRNAIFQPVASLDQLLKQASDHKQERKRQHQPAHATFQLEEAEFPQEAIDGTKLDYNEYEDEDESYLQDIFYVGNAKPATPGGRLAMDAKFCQSFFYKGSCEAGDACLYKDGHKQENIRESVKIRLAGLIRSPQIGKEMVYKLLKEVVDDAKTSTGQAAGPNRGGGKLFDAGRGGQGKGGWSSNRLGVLTNEDPLSPASDNASVSPMFSPDLSIAGCD